ncbi:MAG TPA: ABC transporter substrate-binding protein [Candidatus Binatia bacterium]
MAPLWLAQDLGFFGKYNLAAQIVLVRNNQMLAAGLGAGDIDVGYTGGTTVLGAAAAGIELRLIVGFVSRGRGYLVVRPDIKKAQDLAGKRIAVQSIGGTLWMYVMLTLASLAWIPRATIFACSSLAIRPLLPERWHRKSSTRRY